MMEFIHYFPYLLTVENILILLSGTVIGLLFGAAPGLSPTMVVALMIPLTFHMEPVSALILLGALYTSTVAGGAISAILINVPGAPANIATTFDGHSMAQQGRAKEALHYCFISSFIGGLIGIFVLIFSAPLLAKLALQFGPSEMFWVAILGVTVMATLATDSLLKGLFAGTVGLWLSTIGYSPVLGEARFQLSDHLTGGINIVAALIGLFAIPEVLTRLETSANRKKLFYQLEKHRLWLSLWANLKRLRALTIGTITGSIIGIIPGAGGQIAALVAYDQTRKLSGHPERFGHGEPDGIIAAEAANNAMVGPSLVPLLTLSVPGSPTAAVLLGGLLIHGLFPGPNLFTTHAKTTWTFIDSLLLAQLMMLLIGLFISRFAHFVLRIPGNYMAAAVTVLAILGTYSIQTSYSDVLIMLTLGVGMYIAGKWGFKPAPVVLGLILGPIAETNFLQGKLIAQTGDGIMTYFFSGTINITIIMLCCISLAYSLFNEWKTAKYRQQCRVQAQ